MVLQFVADKLSSNLSNKLADWKNHPPKWPTWLLAVADWPRWGPQSQEMTGKLVLLAGKLDLWSSNLWQTN